MTPKEYRRALATLGLTISGEQTCRLLDLDPRTSRRYASHNEGIPIPGAVALALRLMVKYGERAETWARPA